jgi:tetratricopeptide (TPR) repeat protein
LYFFDAAMLTQVSRACPSAGTEIDIFRPSRWKNRLTEYSLEDYLRTTLADIPPVISALANAISDLRTLVNRGAVEFEQLSNISLRDIHKVEASSRVAIGPIRGLINVMRVGYAHANSSAQAASAINRSLQLNPNQPDGWEALGVAYIDLKRYGEAVTAIQRAIQMNPNQDAFYNNLAAAYAAEADWNNSLRTLEQEEPLAARLNNAQVWYVLGKWLPAPREFAQSRNGLSAVSAAEAELRGGLDKSRSHVGVGRKSSGCAERLWSRNTPGRSTCTEERRRA